MAHAPATDRSTADIRPAACPVRRPGGCRSSWVRVGTKRLTGPVRSSPRPTTPDRTRVVLRGYAVGTTGPVRDRTAGRFGSGRYTARARPPARIALGPSPALPRGAPPPPGG